MAFKRVLSALMVVLVLVSTLCAFKPTEAKFEPLNDTQDVTSIPNVSFDYSFNSLYGSLVVQWNGGYKEITGSVGEGDQIYSLSTVEEVPIEFPPSMYKYNFVVEMGGYSAVTYKIRVYDSLTEYLNGNVKNVYSLQDIFDDDSQTYETIDIFVDSGDYIILDANTVYTSTTKNKFTLNVYVNRSTLAQQYTNGFNNGYQEGVNNNVYYQQGYDEGRAEGVSSGLFGLFTDPIGALFNFVIVPIGENGGITLGAVFLVLVAISLIVIYLKYFAGG